MVVEARWAASYIGRRRPALDSDAERRRVREASAAAEEGKERAEKEGVGRKKKGKVEGGADRWGPPVGERNGVRR